jgi:hypothetical protein
MSRLPTSAVLIPVNVENSVIARERQPEDRVLWSPLVDSQP